MKAKSTDRYVTFLGINGDSNAKRVIEHLRRYIDNLEESNPFWERFKEKLAQVGDTEKRHGSKTDELLMVHCYINNIRELFEQHEDEEALNLLQQVEEESC